MIHLTYKLQDGGYKAEPQKKIHSEFIARINHRRYHRLLYHRLLGFVLLSSSISAQARIENKRTSKKLI